MEPSKSLKNCDSRGQQRCLARKQLRPSSTFMAEGAASQSKAFEMGLISSELLLDVLVVPFLSIARSIAQQDPEEQAAESVPSSSSSDKPKSSDLTVMRKMAELTLGLLTTLLHNTLQGHASGRVSLGYRLLGFNPQFA